MAESDTPKSLSVLDPAIPILDLEPSHPAQVQPPPGARFIRMSKNTSTTAGDRLEELDLMIDNMETEPQEIEVKKILDGLKGVQEGRVVQGGVWVSYHSAKITMEKICAALQQAGYHAEVFQNSNPPVTGTSPD